MPTITHSREDSTMKTRPFKLLENVLHHDSGLQCTHGRRRSKCTFDCVRRVCVMSWMGNREYHLTCKAKIWQREGVRLAIVFVAKLAAVAAAGRMTEGGFSCCRHPLLPRHHHPAYRQSTGSGCPSTAAWWAYCLCMNLHWVCPAQLWHHQKPA